MNVARFLAEKAAPLGGKTALVDGARTVTYEALFREAAGRAVFFMEQGLAPGDRVGLCLPKGIDGILCHLAVILAGGVTLPLNPRATAGEIAYALKDSSASFLIADGENREKARGAPRLPRTLDPGEFVALAPSRDLPARGRDDPALLCYTSGTTGKPKGAVITHGNLIHNMEALRRIWQMAKEDTLLHALPLFHVHGLCVALHTSLSAGAAVALHPAFDPALVSKALESGSVTVFMGVPTMYARLASFWQARGAKLDLGGVRLFISGSAPLPVPLFDRFFQMTGHRILERYGMTETGMIASNPFDSTMRVPGSVGYPLPGVAVRIVRPKEGVGEVQVRGPNVMKGYFRAPEKTAAAFEGPWFRTGDLGSLEGGRLFLKGRANDLIISGGFNVYPCEVEEVLVRHGGVLEAAVLGLSDEDLGERVVACIVPSGRTPFAEDELIAYAKKEIAAYKCPKSILAMASFPRNALGKVLKDRLCKAILESGRH